MKVEYRHLNTPPTTTRAAAHNPKASGIALPSVPPVQRVIHTKNGRTYKSKGDLPYGYKKNSYLQEKVNDTATWLTRNEADLKARGDGQNAPLLSPHRHLIGEIHTESRFETALSHWGWGAAKLMEGLSTSETVKDKATIELQGENSYPGFRGPFYGVGALENLHPFLLSGVAMYRDVLANQALLENHLAGDADEVHRIDTIGFGDRAGALADWNMRQRAVDTERKQVLKFFKNRVLLHSTNYEDACIKIRGTDRPNGNGEAAKLHDLATIMTPHWKALKKSPVAFAGRPYWMITKWVNTGHYLRQRQTDINDYVTNTLDVFGDGINALAKAAAEKENGNKKQGQAIDQNWANVKNGGDPLPEISKTREIFMANNINQMDYPGIVKIGEAHVPNLQGKITRGKYHNSYNDFVADTKA